ncbi:MAG: phage portal protein [Campylobacter sp.]
MSRKNKNLKTSAIKTAQYKKVAPKTNINFFKYPSLEPNKINSYEINQLLRNTNLDKASAKLRAQARSVSASVSLSAGFFETLSSEIFGEKGFILDVMTQDKRLNQLIQNAFFNWEENCCKYGIYDFEDYEEMVLTALYRDGEVFIRIYRQECLKIELIDAEDIDNNLNDENKLIFHGIEFYEDKITPKNYHIKLDNGKYLVISADEILHIKKPKLFKQKRGITMLASAIFDTHSKDKLKKSELDRARLASELTGFLTRKNEGVTVEDMDWDENGEIVQKDINIPQTLQTGTFELLDDNITPHFVDPHNPINMEYFLKSTDRDVARSLGISYATYTGDLKDVNYSSIRHGTIGERRHFTRVQNFIKRKFHNKIFKHWLFCELLNLKISTHQYEQIINNFIFKSQGWEYIDPVKEVNANKIAVENGFKTITEVLREKGVEIDTFMDELEKEKQIAQKIREIKILKGEIDEN